MNDKLDGWRATPETLQEPPGPPQTKVAKAGALALAIEIYFKVYTKEAPLLRDESALQAMFGLPNLNKRLIRKVPIVTKHLVTKLSWGTMGHHLIDCVEPRQRPSSLDPHCQILSRLEAASMIHCHLETMGGTSQLSTIQSLSAHVLYPPLRPANDDADDPNDADDSDDSLGFTSCHNSEEP